MPINDLVVELCVVKMNQFRPDYALYDALVEGDQRTIVYLVNKVYKTEIIQRGFIKEKLNISRMTRNLEIKLNQKRINLRMC